MKAQREAISTDENSSFRILLTPNLNELFYWHFHPEFEIVYVEADHGFRHIGDHISKYSGSDLALIGPNIPHLNFDYGVKATVETVVVQMQEDFLGKDYERATASRSDVWKIAGSESRRERHRKEFVNISLAPSISYNARGQASWLVALLERISGAVICH